MNAIVISETGNASNGSIPEYRFNPDGTVDFRSIPARLRLDSTLKNGEIPAQLPGSSRRVIRDSDLNLDFRPLKNKTSHAYKMAEKQAISNGWSAPNT